jgi:DNA-binding CsgD family transcriptional regulator
MSDSPSILQLLQNAELSPRETAVLNQVKQGFTCKEISENLGIGLETVKTHRKSIVAKLGLRGKVEFRRFILDLLAEENDMLHELLHTHTHTEKRRLTPKSPLGVRDFKNIPTYFTNVITLNKF